MSNQTFRISHDNWPAVHATGALSGVFTGDNWSGGVRLAPPGQSFSAVGGHWVVPNAYAPTSDPFVNSYWVGPMVILVRASMKSSKPASTAPCLGVRAASTYGINGLRPLKWRSPTRQSAPAIW